MFFSKNVSKIKFIEFQTKIRESFNKIKYEISLSYKWIASLNLRVKNIESNSLLELEREIRKTNNKNQELELKNEELKEYNKAIYKKLDEVVKYLNFVDAKVRKIDEFENFKKELKFNVENISNNINNLENNIRNSQITIKNNNESEINDLKEIYIKSFKKIYQVLENQNKKIYDLDRIDKIKVAEYKLDVRSQNIENENVIKNIENNQKEIKENNNFNERDLNLIDGKLSRSEKKLLYVLINSNKNMSYSEISDSSNLNYGTIKNNMYNLRKKGIEVPYILNDKREKLYYLNDEIILRITGK